MPVHSFRRRYLWIHIESKVNIDSKSIEDEINSKIYFLYGVKGAVKINFRVIEFFHNLVDAIISCNHIGLNEMRTTLAHISDINGKSARIDIRLVSGTIKTLKKKMVLLKSI